MPSPHRRAQSTHFKESGFSGTVLVSDRPVRDHGELIVDADVLAAARRHIARRAISAPVRLLPGDLAFLRCELGHTPEGLAVRLGNADDIDAHVIRKMENLPPYRGEPFRDLYEYQLRNLVLQSLFRCMPLGFMYNQTYVLFGRSPFRRVGTGPIVDLDEVARGIRHRNTTGETKERGASEHE